MKALRRIIIAAALAVTALMAAGCGISKIKDIKLTGAGVKYIIPTSLRSFDAVLVLGIDNPAMTFKVSNVDGAIRVDDIPYATFQAGEITVEGRQSQEYVLPCSITLEPDITLIDLLKLAARRSLEGMKADVNLRVASKSGAINAPLKYKNIDLSEFSK